MIVNFTCNQIVAHFCIAKTGHLRCCLYSWELSPTYCRLNASFFLSDPASRSTQAALQKPSNKQFFLFVDRVKLQGRALSEINEQKPVFVSCGSRRTDGAPSEIVEKHAVLFLRVGSRRDLSRNSRRDVVLFRVALVCSFLTVCQVLHRHFFASRIGLPDPIPSCGSGLAQREFVAGWGVLTLCSVVSVMFVMFCVVSTSCQTASNMFSCCWVLFSFFTHFPEMVLVTVARH